MSLKLFLRSSAAVQARPEEPHQKLIEGCCCPLTKNVLKSGFIFKGVMRHFPILLFFPEERVEAVVWVHGNVEMWAKCARCTRWLARFRGGIYRYTISPNISECAKSIRGACTKGGQHQATYADEPLACEGGHGHVVTIPRQHKSCTIACTMAQLSHSW